MFKKCKVCNHQWEVRADFIADDGVGLIGYQANIIVVEKGLFLFNHSCGNTLSIEALAFADLYDGSVYVERLSGTDSCPGHCLYEKDLRPCPLKCECAYVREIIQLLKSKREPA